VGGSGSDDVAAVAGTLTWAEGSFPLEVGGINESDNDASNPGANSYSLQLNTNAFKTSACDTSMNSTWRWSP
jgi:hypothetical protein